MEYVKDMFGYEKMKMFLIKWLKKIHTKMKLNRITHSENVHEKKVFNNN